MTTISECERKRSEIAELIFRNEQLGFEKIIQQVGVETIVCQNIYKIWKDYAFFVHRVLHNWDNCIQHLKKILSEVEINNVGLGENYNRSCIPDCDFLSFEFENLLVSFARLNEEALSIEVCRHLSSSNCTKYKDNCYKRNDEKGLYWEMNLLRNRAAHSPKGYYSEHNGTAARYMSITSKINTIRVLDGKILLPTALISLRNNKQIQNMIKQCFINKEFGEEFSEKPILDIMFPSSSPKGKRKNSPPVIYMSNVNFFDLNSEFLDLSIDMFVYIEKQLHVFNDELQHQNMINTN